MIINNTDNNRLGIYFFYDKDGIVDNYVTYFLDDLILNMKDLLIVCNGKLLAEGRKKLEHYGQVYVRENVGFDVWAYKSGLEIFGWEKLATYDEVVLLNNTIMGPIYPLKETFDKMAEKDLDFWGINKFFESEFDPSKLSLYGYIPDHIQSHFIVFRKSLIKSPEFQEHWDTMPMVNNYLEAIGYHEAIFTKKFADKGFKWDVSVNCEYLRKITSYPLLIKAVEIITKYRCPIFKRRAFFHDRENLLRNTNGENIPELFKYIKEKTVYDVAMIWETILRNYNQYDIFNNLNLTYILSTKNYVENKMTEAMKNQKIAIIMHIYFKDLIDESIELLKAIPKQCDVFLTTNDEEKKKILETKKDEIECNKLEVRVIENRGRDVSSLLIGVNDVILNYDIACFMHDKKTAQLDPGSVGESFKHKCYTNNLASEAYVLNVIDLFLNNENLGILSPPEPNHSNFFPISGNEWGPNYINSKELADEMKLNVPMSRDKPPIAPFGTMFWFRPKAMKKLFEKKWKYEDFPKEPNSFDGSILHAIERIYPFVVQDAGYYPAVVMTEENMALEYINFKFYFRSYNKILIESGYSNYFTDMKEYLYRSTKDYNSVTFSMKLLIKNTARKVLPRSIYRALGRTVRKIQNK